MKIKTAISFWRQRIVILWFGVLLAGGYLTPARADVLDYVKVVTNTPNLLGYWRFDPVFKTNSTVNGYTGTLVGNAQIGAAGSGVPMPSDPTNQALVLDGAGSYLSTSLTGQITNQGSVIAWVNLAAEPFSAGHVFEITAQSQVGNDFDFQIQTDNSIAIFTDNGSATTYKPGLPANQWHFVAVTFVTNGVRPIYVDGVPVTNSIAGGHSVNLSAFAIGYNLVFPGRYFNGRISDVAIFNRALTAAEIAKIYSTGAPLYLQLASLAGTNVLTWPTNFSGYVLQTNANLGNASGWGPLTSNYMTVSTNYVFTNVPASGRLFYRLAH